MPEGMPEQKCLQSTKEMSRRRGWIVTEVEEEGVVADSSRNSETASGSIG